MHDYTFDLVGKIGSMALIRKQDNDMDYNIFSRIGAFLKPGMIWVSSGATEIGRLDYMKRTGGRQLTGDPDEVKTDYAAQGQSILMENYRRFMPPEISVRQLLVEHTHFNDPEKREHIRKLLIRAALQGSVPIVNYNDPVSFEENRKMELAELRSSHDHVVECVDNDETAAVIASIVKVRTLLILTSTDGIYADPSDPSTLIREIGGKSAEEVVANIRQAQTHCKGASRPGANGAYAKLEYCINPVKNGTQVIIGSARHRLEDLLSGRAPCTRLGMD